MPTFPIYIHSLKVTPLGLALTSRDLTSSAKIARILLDHGAEKSEQMKYLTGDTGLLQKNTSTARELLSDDIYTNGCDLSARDLLVVLDLSTIHRVSVENENDELTLHKEVQQLSVDELLLHPLLSAFLQFKTQGSNSIEIKCGIP